MSDAFDRKAAQGYARTAGFVYVLSMAVFMAYFYMTNGFVTPGDFAATARNISERELDYRIALGLRVVGGMTIVMLGWSFYMLLRPVDAGLALLALLLRMSEAALGFAGAGFRYAALGNYLSAADSAPGRDVVSKFAGAFYGASFQISFILLGAGSAIFFALLFKSRIMPRILAGFSLIAAVIFAIQALLVLVLPELEARLGMASLIPMFIAEVGTGLWLWLVGANFKQARPGAARKAAAGGD
jgi:hypothetical protein